MTWQPIETAPKDGTDILAYGPGCNTFAYSIDVALPLITAVVSWHAPEYEDWEPVGDGTARKVVRKLRGVWKPYSMGFFQPTHWMPLPAPPSTSEG